MSGLDPEEAEADRRARRGQVNIWVVVGVLVLLGLAVYAGSALLA